jgi:hypothetical protein
MLLPQPLMVLILIQLQEQACWVKVLLHCEWLQDGDRRVRQLGLAESQRDQVAEVRFFMANLRLASFSWLSILPMTLVGCVM